MNLNEYIEVEVHEVIGDFVTLELVMWDNWDEGRHYLCFTFVAECDTEDGCLYIDRIASGVDVQLRLHGDYDRVVAGTYDRTDVDVWTIGDLDELFARVADDVQRLRLVPA